MKRIFSSRRQHFRPVVSIFLIILIMLTLTAGMVSCAPVQYTLTIASTAGGSVTTPGVGTFTYNAGTVVNLVAEAEEGYRFVNWTGDVNTIADLNDATTTITMEDDYSITANFGVSPMIADFGGPFVCSHDPTERAYIAVEGFALTLDASASYHHHGTIVLYEWDVDNDGTYDLAVDTPTTLYTYNDDYEGAIVLRVTDNEGLTATDTGFIICLNEPPVVDAGGNVTATVGTAVEFHGRFYDPGNDDFSYSWDFGDGTAQRSGTVTGEPAGLHLLTVTHTYSVAGNYTVTLTVSDDRNTSANTAVVRVSSDGGASSLALPPLLTATQLGVVRPAVGCMLVLSETPLEWLPRYINKVNHTATIVGEEPQIIKFVLTSSNEPGYCMNYPQPMQAWFGSAEPDLRFVQEDQVDPNIVVLHPTIARTINPVLRATIVTRSYDFGSYGVLTAYTEMCGHAEVKIPFDADGNNIADGWEFNAGAAIDDRDANPVGDGTAGDGFSRYQEYRGFKVGGSHFRTSPNNKDLFIRDQDNINRRADVPQLGVQLHWIDNDQWQNGNTRIVNYNSGFAHAMNQSALRLTDGGVDPTRPGWWGVAWARAGAGNWVPNTVFLCTVYTGNIRNNWPPPPPPASPPGAPQEDEVITRTVAHELAHGVNIDDDIVGDAPPPPLYIMTEYLPAGWAVGHTFKPGTGAGTLSQLRIVP